MAIEGDGNVGGRKRRRCPTMIGCSSERKISRMFGMIVIFFTLAFLGTTNHQPRVWFFGRFGAVAALTVAQRRAVALSRIRKGMLLSQEAQQNVTAAEEACSVWESVLPKLSSAPSLIAPDVRSLSQTLYASCLVRVGRDDNAIAVYDSCLTDFAATETHETITKWRLAKARCLQRLLKYSEAAEEYTRALADFTTAKELHAEEPQAKMGAATCILRSTGDVSSAYKILADAPESEARMLSCCLEYLETGNENQAVNRLQQVLSSTIEGNDTSSEERTNSDSSTSFLLYRWILAALKRTHCRNNLPGKEDSTETMLASMPSTVDPKDLFLELIRINTSPLDDKDLLRLDDKIELHNLLTNTTRGEFSSSSYWPEGLVLPGQSSKLHEMVEEEESSPQLWISKSRAGYGSHGNQILTLEDAKEEINGIVDNAEKHAQPEATPNAEATEPYLLQRMIDPLLLLQGYKFSLRIYVVFFSSDEAYISSKGLVKLASTPLFLGDNSTEEQHNKRNPILDTKMHMTNSGRETVMQQEDLEYLWKEFDNPAEKEAFWKDLCKVAADTLLRRYPERIQTLETTEAENAFGEQKRVWKHRREDWGIPKILGLDFVVQDDADSDDASARRRKPWLVEVNRFPGLEPRDEDDRKIKYRVVRDAWKKASERLAHQGDDGNAFDFDDTILECLSSDGDDGNDALSSLERLRL